MTKRRESFLRKRTGGIFKSAVALLVFVSAAGTLGWMLMLPGAIESTIEERTGCEIEVESLFCNPLGFSFDGKGIEVGLPPTFGESGSLLEIESIKGSLSLPSLGRGELWFHELEVHVKKATVVVDERGQSSLMAFGTRLFTSPELKVPMPFFAEKVHLVIDEVELVDNSKPVPVRQSVRSLLDVTYHDVGESQKLFDPIQKVQSMLGGL